jgi:hypothetical protein
MLYISLVLSLILLVFAYQYVRRPERPPAGFSVCGLALIFLFCGVVFHAVALHLVLLTVALVLWRNLSGDPRLAFPVLLIPTAVAYGITGWFALEEQRKFADLRARFPYESLEERLPLPQRAVRPDKLPNKTNEWLTSLEESVKTETTNRSHILGKLHEEKVSLFVNSRGFGVTRMTFSPDERDITYRLRQEPPVPQPGSQEHLSGSSGEELSQPPRGQEETLSRMHQEGIVDFANIAGFGFVKDRRHVAGFQSHRFSKVPKPAERWEVHRLDLIGLLLHDEPVAYISEYLPRMDELREAPTRLLDSFETLALGELRRGNDLSVEEIPSGLRMMGAIRSVKQCVECHGGERGDLLGAFSYTLHQSAR